MAKVSSMTLEAPPNRVLCWAGGLLCGCVGFRRSVGKRMGGRVPGATRAVGAARRRRAGQPEKEKRTTKKVSSTPKTWRKAHTERTVSQGPGRGDERRIAEAGGRRGPEGRLRRPDSADRSPEPGDSPDPNPEPGSRGWSRCSRGSQQGPQCCRIAETPRPRRPRHRDPAPALRASAPGTGGAGRPPRRPAIAWTSLLFVPPRTSPFLRPPTPGSKSVEPLSTDLDRSPLRPSKDQPLPQPPGRIARQSSGAEEGSARRLTPHALGHARTDRPSHHPAPQGGRSAVRGTT